MEKPLSRPTNRVFGLSNRLFADLTPDIALRLASTGADVTLLIRDDGVIADVAYGDSTLDRFGMQTWPGRKWRDTVTGESVDKIAALIAECAKEGKSRAQQVNHPGADHPDLPVEYVVLKVPGFPHFVAYGTDLRKFAEIQQQLIQAQFELEREYRRIRETEARYRVIFQKMEGAVLVIDSGGRRIIDANGAVSAIFGSTPAKLVNETFPSLFEREDRDNVVAALADARNKSGVQQVSARISGRDTLLQLRIDPYRENGRINMLVNVSRANGDSSPRGSDAVGPHAGWLEAIPEAMVLIDPKGAIRDLNDRFLDIIHILNRNQVIGRNISNWVGASAVDMQVLSTRLRDEGEVRQFLTVARDDMGTSRPMRLSAARLENGGEGLVAILMTEHVQRESQLTVRSNGAHTASSDFAELIGRVPLKELIREAVDVIEKLCIEAALRQTENNRASAADLLGLSRQSLYMKLRRHSLEDFDGSA